MTTNTQAPCALCGSENAERGFWDPKSEKQVPTCASAYLCLARQREADRVRQKDPLLRQGQFVRRSGEDRTGKIVRVDAHHVKVRWPSGDVTLEPTQGVRTCARATVSKVDFKRLTTCQ